MKSRTPLPITSLILHGVEREVAYPLKLDQKNWLGSYTEAGSRIEILRSLSPASAFKVFVHEVFHHLWSAIRAHSALRTFAAQINTLDASDIEEYFVGALSDELWKLLVANCDRFKELGPLWDTLLSPEQQQKTVILGKKGESDGIRHGPKPPRYCGTSQMNSSSTRPRAASRKRG